MESTYLASTDIFVKIYELYLLLFMPLDKSVSEEYTGTMFLFPVVSFVFNDSGKQILAHIVPPFPTQLS